MEQKFKKKIFFRDDDVDELTVNLKELIAIFLSHNVPIHLAVVPARLTQECADYLARKVRESAGIIEIGQHGHLHEDRSFSADKFGKYEFGQKRSYRQQREDIVGGREILKRHFQESVDIFTPPWHGFDDNTLRVLSEEGFRGLSADNRRRSDRDLYGLSYIPVNVDFNKRNDDGRWVTEENAEILRKIDRTTEQYVGILLHHKAFNGNDEFRQLDELLRFLKSKKYAKFIHLSKWQETNAMEPCLREEAVAYFLNYQFVPKPLTITEKSANPIWKNFNFDHLVDLESVDQKKDAICEGIYAELKESIKAQLPATDEPIGVLLSGGLDSAVLLHLLREVTDREICTLTGAYSPNAANLSSARLLAQKYGTVHEDLIVSPDDFLKIDSLYDKSIPQPIGDNGFLPTYLMLERLKERTQHVFSGDGADCLFCGLRMHRLDHVDRGVAAPSLSNGGYGSLGRFAYAHYRFGEIFLNEQELDMAFEGRLNSLRLEGPLQEIDRKIKTADPVKRQIWLDLLFLARNRVDYLIYAARAAGVIIHLPYLSGQFVSFATKIPSGYLQGTALRQKDILRKAFEGKLPQNVLDRNSEGFTPPFKLWFYKNKDFVVRKLASARKFGISGKYIRYLGQNYRDSHVYEKGMKIWLLINLVSWYDRCTRPNKQFCLAAG